METKVVSYVKDGKETHRVIVGEETAIARMRRATLKTKASQEPQDDIDIRIMQFSIYPDCVSAVVDWCGNSKPTFEEFCELPGQFVDDWIEAVWEVCPMWKPDYNPESTEELEKKQPS